MINPYAAGAKVYRGGSSAATVGTVDPMGYIERGLRQRMAGINGGSMLAGPQSSFQTRSGLAAAALRRQQGMPVGTPTAIPNFGLSGLPNPTMHQNFGDGNAIANPIVASAQQPQQMQPQMHQQFGGAQGVPTPVMHQPAQIQPTQTAQQIAAPHTHQEQPPVNYHPTSGQITPHGPAGSQGVENPGLPALTGPVGYVPPQAPQPNPTGHITLSDIMNSSGAPNLGHINNVENQMIPGLDSMQLAAVRKAFPWFGNDLTNPHNQQQAQQGIQGLRQNAWNNLTPDHFAQMLQKGGEGDYLDLINQARQSGTPQEAYQELMNNLPEQRHQQINAVNDVFSKVFPILSHIAKRKLSRGVV